MGYIYANCFRLDLVAMIDAMKRDGIGEPNKGAPVNEFVLGVPWSGRPTATEELLEEEHDGRAAELAGDPPVEGSQA